MRNPFRALRRGEEEKRLLDTTSVSFPLDPLSALPSSVSVDRALRLAPVFAAGRLLSSSVAGLPLQVYRKRGEEREKLPLPPLLRAPTVTGTRRDWLFRAMTSLVYRGNAVGLITERDALEFPIRVEWLNPDDVTVEDRLYEGPGSFTDPVWRVLGERVSRVDLIHIPWFVLPGRVWGMSPIVAYAATVHTGLAAQQFSRDWFDSGGVPPGTFANSTQTVDQKESAIIKRRLIQAIRSHEPIVYGKDWTYTPITVSPNEAKFVETMRLGATEIASIYGIPPEMIGGETGGSYTYSSPEQREIEFVQVSLLPWLTTLEDALSGLLPRGQYVKFNVDALIRTDAQTRYTNYKTARDIGLMNVDELRALEDMPPLPDGQGTDYTPLPLQKAGIAPQPPAQQEDGEPRQLRLVGGDTPKIGRDHG